MTESYKKYRNPAELKIAAKENLDGKWLVAIAVCIVAWLLTEAFTYRNGGNSSIRYIMENGHFIRAANFRNPAYNTMSLVYLILGGPIYFGVAGFFLKLARYEPAEFSDMFSGFRLFRTNFVLNLLIVLFTVLWSLLFIIPGIIAAIEYSMAYYILNDNPGMGAMEAINLSKKMMEGHRMRFLEMWLSFLGWFILGIVTLGLGMLYAIPYFRAAKANFYLDLKGCSIEPETAVMSAE